MKIKSGWIPGILATALASSCSSAPGSSVASTNSPAIPANSPATLTNSSAPSAKNSRVQWGVNLAGAEFAFYLPLPGTYGENYGYPNEVGQAPKGAELGYYAGKGLKLVRLPFLWERMQDGLNGPLRESEVQHLRAFLEEARQGGFKVIPDCHNYARFYGLGDDKTRREYVVGVDTDLTALGDLWKKLIPRLSDYGDVIWAWDIMNEPRNMGAGGNSEDEGGKQLWADVAQSTVSAIRSVDKRTPILVAGYQYSPTDRWTQYSDKLKNLSDPSNKLIFEGHTYWDSDRSGTYNPNGGGFDFDKQTGGDLTRSVGALTDFVSWLRANKKQGFLGEFSVPAVAGGWQTLLSRFVIEVNTHDSDVIRGGTFWAGGSRWNNDETGAVLDGLHARGDGDLAHWRDKINLTTYLAAIGGTPAPEPRGVAAQPPANTVANPTPAANDAILAVVGPATVAPGQFAKVRVSYSTKALRKLEVSLKDPAHGYAWQGGATVDVPAGTGSVVVAVPINANATAGEGLAYTARLNQMSGALIQEVIQRNISIAAGAPATGAK